MRKTVLAAVAGAALVVSGCQMTPQDRVIAGGLAGATVGLVTASIFNASPGWTVAAAIGGAAVGTLVARNQLTGECAYAAGGGRYRIAPCPS